MGVGIGWLKCEDSEEMKGRVSHARRLARGAAQGGILSKWFRRSICPKGAPARGGTKAREQGREIKAAEWHRLTAAGNQVKAHGASGIGEGFLEEVASELVLKYM